MAPSIGVAVVCLLCVASGFTQPMPARDPTVRPVWRTTQATVGTPAIGGNDVFALTADHQLLKVSLDDGSELWRVKTGEEGTTYGHALAVTSLSVLVGEYDLAAFDRITGRLRWTFVPRDGYAPGPYLGDVHRDEIALTGSASGHAYALNVRTGLVEWAAVVDPDQESTVYAPRVDGRQVIAGFTHYSAPNRGGLVALDITDGRERWRFAFPPQSTSTHLAGGPVVAGEVVVAASGDGRIWAVDSQTGELRWTLPAITGELDSIVPAGEQDQRALATSGSTLLVGSTTGYVIAFDMGDQREVWRFPGGRLGSTAFAIAAANGVAFVPYVSGFLVALNGATGAQRWRTSDWQQGFIWPPALAGNRAVASSRQGLWALRIHSEDEP
jgi:eukaryotic-like serine/threonine-protein kinase